MAVELLAWCRWVTWCRTASAAWASRSASWKPTSRVTAPEAGADAGVSLERLVSPPSAAKPLPSTVASSGDEAALAEADLRAHVRDLQRALAAQRESLDALAEARERDRQEAAASSAQETAQLKSTIAALRDALAVIQAEKDRAVQQALSVSAQEIAQLKATVSTLRDALEAAHHEHEQALQAAGREQQDENRHLLQTVVRLREQLDLARAPQSGALSS